MTPAGASEISVEGPYLASVLAGEGEVCGPLANLAPDLLRRCRPVRAPAAYADQRHMPGSWYSTTAGRHLEHESLLERDWMLVMDFDPRVEWICEQPLRLRYTRDGRKASHVPDLLCLRCGEPPRLCDVRGEDRRDEDFRAAATASERACTEAGWRYAVLAEPEPRRLSNLRLLAGYRHPLPDPDGERRRMAGALVGGERTIAGLLADAREPLLARPVLMGMLWHREARVDLDSPITDASVVGTG